MEPTSGIELTGQARLADEVRRDLGGSPKRLQPHYLYDALGSKLFEAICALPEYRITRAECQLLSQHAGQILAGLALPSTVVELGGGSGEKLALVVEPVGHGVPDRDGRRRSGDGTGGGSGRAG